MEASVGLELAALLFACALGIGCLDAISGGGGLLTVPLLLALGFPPTQALATNKLQGVFGTGSSTLTFTRAGTVHAAVMWPAALCAAIGAAFGTLRRAADRYGCAAPSHTARPHCCRSLFHVVTAHRRCRSAGARADGGVCARRSGRHRLYDGLLGLGTGAFLVAATAGLLGQNLRAATAHAKLLNFTSNVGSLTFFVLGGNVVWAAGFAMAVGQVIGARLGARAVLAKGAKLVRPLVVLAALAMAARLLLEQR